MGLTFSQIFANFYNKELRIVMVGLDSAGKTTMLYYMKWGEVVTSIPTIGFNVETVEYQGVSFTVWDLGGQNKIRNLWKHYYKNSDGIIFVVDSTDRERMELAKVELHKLLEVDELQNAALLVFANKCDMADAASKTEVMRELNLASIRNRPVECFSCSAVTGENLKEGMVWLKLTLTG